MTPHDRADVLLARLAELPPLSPGEGHAARIRARCHARLARIGHRQPEPRPGVGLRLVAPAVLLVFCAVYVASLVSTVLQLRSLF
jgi:hypothetical protein